jgi:ribonuclease VapC
MVIDTSAVVAVLFDEPGWEFVNATIARDAGPVMSAVTRVECGLVVEARYRDQGRLLLEDYLVNADITVIPTDDEQVRLALDAWRRYGRGRHPARLNLGDCFSYALAKARGDRLLYVGNDFSQTDVGH